NRTLLPLFKFSAFDFSIERRPATANGHMQLAAQAGCCGDGRAPCAKVPEAFLVSTVDQHQRIKMRHVLGRAKAGNSEVAWDGGRGHDAPAASKKARDSDQRWREAPREGALFLPRLRL